MNSEQIIIPHYSPISARGGKRKVNGKTNKKHSRRRNITKRYR